MLLRRLLVITIAVGLLVHAFLPSPGRANSLLLDATTKALEMETSAAISTDYVVSYADHTTTTFTPGMNQGNVSTATTTTILSAPAASTQRQVKWASVRNRSTTTAQTVTLKLDVSGTEYHIGPAVTLQPGEALRVGADGGATVFAATSGLPKMQATEFAGYGAQVLEFFKIGGTSEAVAVRYGYANQSGLPGAWVPGTPGLNGAATNCDAAAGAATMGAPVITDPAAGSLFITMGSATTTVAHYVQFLDIVWYNTGLVMTTTTNQAITQPTLPSRDAAGTNNGAGWNAGLFVTTITGNVGAITNTTMTYTDQSGNGGATATMASFPVSGVAGTLVPFQLAAGDTGVRSIQGVTLGTSYVSGAMSLVHYRTIVSVPSLVANVGGAGLPTTPFTTPGIRIYNDTCLWPIYIASSTTATNLEATLTVAER